jgi:hypothetical protein
MSLMNSSESRPFHVRLGTTCIGHCLLERAARNCSPRAVVSCPVHHLPLLQSGIRSRLNHIHFTSDCTPVFATAYSRGGRKTLSPPGLPFRVLKITFPSNKSHSISPDSCPFHLQTTHRCSQRPWQEGDARCCGPWTLISCLAHHLLHPHLRLVMCKPGSAQKPGLRLSQSSGQAKAPIGGSAQAAAFGPQNI